MKNQNQLNIMQEKLLHYLEELKALESKLWGFTIQQLVSGEEEVLENTNHLIYKLQNKNHQELKEELKNKEIEEFLEHIKELKEDFTYLKKKVHQENVLKNLITNYTIKLVDKKTYPKLQEIFLLEKQLNEVLEVQEEAFNILLKDVNQIKLKEFEKEELFIETLKKIRNILAGHMDHHDLWEEERQGFSNTSNIILSLKKIILASL